MIGVLKSSIAAAVRPVISAAVGLGAGLVLTWVAGENPLHVLSVLAKSAFGGRYALGMTLFYSTPLILTGLSVATAYRAGMFNVGAEGQLTLGALAGAAVGILLPGVPAPWGWLLGVSAAALAGGAWGALAGWLRARRGAHEVITTIMLNFVATGLASYVTLYLLKDPASQGPETLTVGPGYVSAHLAFFGDAPVSLALLTALLAAVAVAFLFNRTVLGFEMKAVGQSEDAARVAGIEPGAIRIWAMFLAGALAGLVGDGEVFGNAGRFRVGFSPDYGFIGIAVALLGRSSPMGVVAAAFLFGALHKGAADLDIETDNITRDLSAVLQALIILAVAAAYGGALPKLRLPKRRRT